MNIMTSSDSQCWSMSVMASWRFEGIVEGPGTSSLGTSSSGSTATSSIVSSTESGTEVGVAAFADEEGEATVFTLAGVMLTLGFAFCFISAWASLHGGWSGGGEGGLASARLTQDGFDQSPLRTCQPIPNKMTMNATTRVKGWQLAGKQMVIGQWTPKFKDTAW